MINIEYILPPLLGGLIGWSTNYLAIKLLFRPILPISVLGITFQGIIPKRREEISTAIAETVERELLSSKDISSALDNIDWQIEVEKTVHDIIEHKLSSSSVKQIPIIGLLSENINYHIKYLVTSEILKQLEKKKGDISTRLTKSVDIQNMLSTKIDQLDLEKFENLLTSFISKELKYIELLGAIMGFIIGSIQSVYMYTT